MPYPEMMIYGMRAELAQLGIEETKTTEAVEDAVRNTDGTLMVVVNSVCGCAAGTARPGVIMAVANAAKKPDHIVTTFAGYDVDAVKQARNYLLPYPPSSPAIALLKDGKVVHMVERHMIEGRPAQMIAANLLQAFETYC